MLKILALLALLLPGTASAQMWPFPGPGRAAVGGGGYTGPGDVIGSATGYWSCTRAYNNSYAAGLGNACDLVRASDSASCTMVFQANGNADVATTSSCTGATQTVTQFCNATTCRVSQAYDQTGNGRHMAQGTNGTRPTFDPAGAKVMVFAGSQGLINAGTTISQPYSISAVAQRTSGTANACIFCVTTGNAGLIFSSAGNSAVFSPTVQNVAAVNSVCHNFQSVANGASSSLMVDGVANTPLGAGANGVGVNWGIGSNGTATAVFLTGTIREIILYSSSIVASQSALSTNQSNYGGC